MSFAPLCHAQSVTPENEYRKLIRVSTAEMVDPASPHSVVPRGLGDHRHGHGVFRLLQACNAAGYSAYGAAVTPNVVQDQGARMSEIGKVGIWLILSPLSAAAQAGTKYYYYTDPQGTVLAEADAQGNIIARYDYAPYGKPVLGTPPSGPAGYTGHVNDAESGFVYMQQRYYDPAVGRFLSVDPVGPNLGNGLNFNRYVYANNNPIVNIDPNGQDAIPVVFPDYKVTTPIGKIGGIGHAGIILIDNKTGNTRYFEYGRYDKHNIGLVRTRQVPNVTIGKSGAPTPESLKKLLSVVSKVGGGGTRIEGTYIKNDFYKEMLQYATNRMNKNSESSIEKYSLISNNCATFCKVTLEAGGESTPSIIDPRPNSYIDELRGTFGSAINYDPSSNRVTCGNNGGDCAQPK